MAVYEHDVLVIGGGLAGMRAAIAAQRTRRRCRDDLEGPSRSARTRTPRRAASTAPASAKTAARGKSTPTRRRRPRTTSATRTRSTVLAQEGGREVLQAEHWGVVFSRKPDGQMAVRRFGGMGKARTFFVGAITGQAILHVLYEQLMHPARFQAMRMYEEWFVTSLIVEDGQLPRLRRDEHPHRRAARDHRARRRSSATGGLGRVYEPSTNALICTGDGIARRTAPARRSWTWRWSRSTRRPSRARAS